MTLAEEALAVEAVTEANPYLAGAYAPVRDEISTAELPVIGELPADLHGIYLRTGPNPQHPPVGRYHWFDGDGMVHAVHFDGGKATYRNRWVRTEAFTRELAAGKPLWTGVMEPLRGNPRDLPLKDSANTTLHLFDRKVIALWYLCGQPYTLDPLTLETLGARDFGRPRGSTMSAHAKVDESTDELFFFDYGRRPPYLKYGVIGADGRVAHEVPIELPGARLPHDMAITENYAVLMDLPLVNDEEAARQGRYKIVFRRDWPARFGVIPRRGRGDEIRWFTAKPCYIYHVVNSWESGDEIVLDCCRVRRPQPHAAAKTPLAKLLSYLRLDAQLYRYRFNLVTGATTEEQLDDANTEFPTVDLSRTGRPTRYAYAVNIAPEPTLLFDGITRYDTTTGGAQTYRFGPGRWGSEAPFAPRPGATAEDDGYLVSFVYDQREDRSEVVILDAADLAAGPRARILLPQRVPIGFHATWVRGDQLDPARPA